jgi:hypothetical protein
MFMVLLVALQENLLSYNAKKKHVVLHDDKY